ncbi:MAG: VOC family protein [Bryobacteraceae bacterium]|nr:VOC family protein [Bryobacteraceae bacterium]
MSQHILGIRSRRRWIGSLIGAGALGGGARAAQGLFPVVEINHMALAVADPNRSRAFYRKLLGARTLQQDERSCALGLEKDYFTLVNSDRPGLLHFAIAVKGFESREAAAKLKDGGYGPQEKEGGSIVVADPDGNQVRLSAPEERREQIGAAYAADRKPDSVFQGFDINHVAIRVRDLDLSREFYQKLFGLRLMSQDSGSCFLDVGGDFLTMFRRDGGGLDHFCFTVDDYQVDRVMKTLIDNGYKPRRTANRVYFPDPDGLTVQLAERGHSA